MRKIIGIAVAFLLIGCGGGGGGGDSSAPAPPAQEVLTGTYTMTGFLVRWSNGVTVTTDSPGVESWSGRMEIGPTTIMQDIELNGFHAGGTYQYNCVWDTHDSGTIYTNNGNASFTLSGGAMTTYSGVRPSDIPGVTGEEWDYWQKTSESYTIRSNGEAAPQSDNSGVIGTGVESLL